MMHVPFTATMLIALAVGCIGARAVSAQEGAQQEKGEKLPATIRPLVRTADLDIGETQDLELADGSKARVKLLDVRETRDRVRNAVREAKVTVEVNGTSLDLTSATYHLPVTVAGVQIDCPITKGYLARDSHQNTWALQKDARVRLWPVGSSWIRPGTFVYPVRQRWCPSDTQMANEPCYVNGAEMPAQKDIYYHYGLDFGGAEGLVEVVTATDGLVVSAAGKALPEYQDSPAQPRYDVIYVLDGRGWYYRYSHLMTIEVQPGQRVRMGERIGLLGKEGGSGGWSHLHFDITSRQPSGAWGIQDAYAYAWQAYQQEYRPKILAVARPHHLVTVGEKVVLDGTKSWSADGRIVRYEWTFTEGSTASGATTERTYKRPGTYSEVLKVTDEAGQAAADFAVVEVQDLSRPNLLPPSIHAAYFPTTNLRPGDAVTFKVRSFRTTDGEERWDFGDGSPPVSVRSDGNVNQHAKNGYAVTEHRYAKPGTYLVRVERSNQRGEKAIGHLVVEVLDSGASAAPPWRGRPALAFRDEGVPPSNRGHELAPAQAEDARDTQGQDALATAGPPRAVPIVTAPNADAVERVAAQELAAYLKRLYPAHEFPVREGRPTAGPEILVGIPDTWPDLARFVPEKELVAPESFHVRASAETGVIAGADPRGVLFGVYALLEKLGCGFYLSSDAVPEPKGAPFDFSSWALEDRPLFADRIVFDWHNFLSSASTWELEDWRQYISQAARMRFNTIMVHAYGNNPMFTFTHNGQTKPVGYAATTQSGRDWGTQHVNDVRRLVGGEVFAGPVFGSSIGLAPEERRVTAAVDLMQETFALARSRGLHVTFALDVDTESANPQNIIRTLPASARLKSGMGVPPTKKDMGKMPMLREDFELVNPDTPEGFAYYLSQVRQLLETYPEIDRLAVWFRTGGTPWRNFKPEQFPSDWKREFDAALEKDPWLRKDVDAHGMFAMGRLLRVFQRVLRELGRTDVELAAGSWRLPFLRAADHFFPREVPLIPLDWETVFEVEKGQQQLRQVRAGRRLIPIVWAHHDDRTYIGRPYRPFERFASQLRANGGTGFGIIHWTTRPLDLYFKSLSEQVWQATADRPPAETCADFAARSFGEPARRKGGEYLLAWLNGAPMFGRETSNRFMDIPLADVEGNLRRFEERRSLLTQIDEAALSPQGRERLAYYRDYERFMQTFYESHSALDQAAQLLKKGAFEPAREALAKCRPEEVIRAYVQAATRGQISRGEQALIVSLNLRWLPYAVSLRQALGLEPVRIKFLPTQHEPLAQGAGTNTFYVDAERQLWKGLGEKETGCPTVQLPDAGGRVGSYPTRSVRVDSVDAWVENSPYESGLRIDKPVTLRLGPIAGEKFVPGRYTVRLMPARPPAENAGSAELELRGARTESETVRATVDPSAVGTSDQRLDLSHEVQIADGQLELSIRPVRGTVFVSGVLIAAEPEVAQPWRGRPALVLRDEGVPPSNQGQDALATGGVRRGVSIRQGRWFLNDQVTYRGTKAEGLLMNVRMVNATFEDRNRPDFDPEANTDEFIAQIPDYVAQGVRGFTLCLQGGMPGYEGAVNSAFHPDGSLRDSYLRRVRRVIEACDRHGAAVILGCYYQRQDQILTDEAAVRAGVVNVARWVMESGFTNVVLEIANEFDHSGFDYRLLKTPAGMAELIGLAKQTAPALLVSASGLGHGRLPEEVAQASDFLLIHFNGTRVDDIPGRIAALRKYNKPIVCNEDEKIGGQGAQACELSVENGASWGFMHVQVNQHHPFTFQGAADDPEVYAAIKRLTSASPVRSVPVRGSEDVSRASRPRFEGGTPSTRRGQDARDTTPSGVTTSEGTRLRLIIETDVGGDPDDEQSLVRFLLYANEWDVEGIIANRPATRRPENKNPEDTGLAIVRRLLEAYGRCHPSLVRHDPRYPTKEFLWQRTVAGYNDTDDAVNLIIAAVDKDDPRPVWYSDWGTDRGAATNNLKRALDRILRERGPEGYAKFKSKLRLSSYDQFDEHTTTLAPPFPVWVNTFEPPVEGKRWYHRYSALTSKAGGFDLKRDVLTGHGPLGALYPTNTGLWGKEGDTMTFLYLVPTGMNDPNEPLWGSWAGRYGRNEAFPGKRYYWANQTETWKGTTNRDNTLARWAVDLQSDFAARLDWCVKPRREANHAPRAIVNGIEGKGILRIAARSGQEVSLDAGLSRDPDGDTLTYEWFIYREAGTYAGEVSLANASSPVALLRVPREAADKTIHVVLALRDNGSPSLAAYRRVVVQVSEEAGRVGSYPTRSARIDRGNAWVKNPPYVPPPESQGGWRKLDQPQETREIAGVDPAKLDELKQWLLQSDKRNFAAVVIRHGHIVLEVERGNSAKTDSRRVASVSKAVCATVLAIASERSQQGLTPKKMTFDDPAFQFIPWAQPLSDPRKAQITVKQLLNHTSGLCPEALGAPNDGTWEYVLGHSGDPRTAKLAFDPGAGCGYSTHALCHAALVCETVIGKPYDQFAIEALFTPLGIEHWWFQYFQGGAKIGRHPTHGLGMPARDLARIAYCMLREGRWGDRQVIPKWFVDQTAASTHSVTSPEMRWKLDPRTFSHGWELAAFRSEGIPADARYKPGSGGQLVAFVPSLDLVVTRQTGSSGEWAYEEYLRRACAAVLPGPGGNEK